MRTITTENSEHATQVAKALLDAADGDTSKVRTVSGPNGLTAFEVEDDFPDVDIPEAEQQQDQSAGQNGEQPQEQQQPEPVQQETTGNGDTNGEDPEENARNTRSHKR